MTNKCNLVTGVKHVMRTCVCLASSVRGEMCVDMCVARKTEKHTGATVSIIILKYITTYVCTVHTNFRTQEMSLHLLRQIHH